MTATWKFRWYRSWKDVWQSPCLDVWNRLFENNPTATVFHNPAVVKAWAETMGSSEDIEPLVGVASQEAGESVLLPWIVVSYSGRFARRRVVEPAGQAFFGYQDPLSRDAAAVDWACLWSSARRSTSVVADQTRLPFVRPESAPGDLGVPSSEMSPVLRLEGLTSLDAVLARTSANHRGDVRRRLRRLRERGSLRLWVADESERTNALRDFRQAFLPAYDRIWSSRPTGNMFERFRGLVPFCERVIEDGIRDGWGHYCSLVLDGEPIAWHLGLQHADELYWWIPTHSVAERNYSPNKVLLALLIERATQRGVRALHFQTGGADYKLKWNPEPTRLKRVEWYSARFKGQALALYDRSVGQSTVSP